MNITMCFRKKTQFFYFSSIFAVTLLVVSDFDSNPTDENCNNNLT